MSAAKTKTGIVLDFKTKGENVWTPSHGVSYPVVVPMVVPMVVPIENGILIHKSNSRPLDRFTSQDLFEGL